MQQKAPAVQQAAGANQKLPSIPKYKNLIQIQLKPQSASPFPVGWFHVLCGGVTVSVVIAFLAHQAAPPHASDPGRQQ